MGQKEQNFICNGLSPTALGRVSFFFGSQFDLGLFSDKGETLVSYTVDRFRLHSETSLFALDTEVPLIDATNPTEVKNKHSKTQAWAHSLFSSKPGTNGKKRMSISTVSLILVGLIGVGIGGGVYFGKFLSDLLHTDAPTPDAALLDNKASDKMISKYQGTLKSGESFATNNYEVDDVLSLAAYIFDSKEETSWYCQGSAVASIVDQKIVSCGFKKNDQYFSESLSKSSMVATGHRATQKDGKVYYIDSSEVKDGCLSASWTGKNPTTAETSTYADLYGYDLTHFTNYFFGNYKDAAGNIYNSIIKEPTSASDEEPVSYKKQNSDGTYTVYVRLDTFGGVKKYAQQMISLSGLEAEPHFKYCRLTFTLEKDLAPRTLKIEECYNAKKFGANATTTANMTVNYNTSSSPDIPDQNTDVDYSLGGFES